MDAHGKTPDQTLSRVLQELRRDGIIHFLDLGKYLLLDTPIDIEAEDLPDEAIDLAINNGKLRIGVVCYYQNGHKNGLENRILDCSR